MVFFNRLLTAFFLSILLIFVFEFVGGVAVGGFALAHFINHGSQGERSGQDGGHEASPATIKSAFSTIPAGTLILGLIVGVGVAFSGVLPWCKPGSDRGQGCCLGVMAVVFLLMVGGAAVTIHFFRRPQVQGFLWLEGRKTVPNKDPLAATPEAVAIYKRMATERYPDLALAGTPLNTLYVTRYNTYKKQYPAYFTYPDWPLALADETYLILNHQMPVMEFMPSPSPIH